MIEVRIDNRNFNVNADYSKYDSFSIGHESCIHKFWDIVNNKKNIEFLKVIKKEQKEIKLLTPFIPEKLWDDFSNRFKVLISSELFMNSVIIVNDLGLLTYVHKLETDRKFCMGRSLIFSFEYTPWGDMIYESEDESIKAIIKQLNFYDDDKINYYRKYNVSEIEVNYKPGIYDSIKNIEKKGIRVIVNKRDFLYGIQRSCEVKRKHNNRQDCQSLCDDKTRICLYKIWEQAEYYDPDNISFPTELYISGNSITGNCFDDEKNFENMILNV